MPRRLIKIRMLRRPVTASSWAEAACHLSGRKSHGHSPSHRGGKSGQTTFGLPLRMVGYPLRPMPPYPMGREGTFALARMRTICKGLSLPFSATKIFLINHLHLSKALGHSPSHRVICRGDAEKRECPPFLPIPFRLRFLIPPQKPRSPPPQRDLFLLVIRTFLIKHPHLSEDRSDAACRVG